MTAHPRTPAVVDRRAVLSAAWIVVLFNYLYADLAMMIFAPAMYQPIASRMPATVVLGWTVFIELAIVMILLSRLLRQSLNRWTNIVVALLQLAGAAMTLAGGIPAPFFAFTALVEVVCLVFVIVYAWTWTSDTAAVSTPSPRAPTLAG